MFKNDEALSGIHRNELFQVKSSSKAVFKFKRRLSNKGELMNSFYPIIQLIESRLPFLTLAKGLSRAE